MNNKKTRIKDMSYTTLQEKDMPKINDFSKITKISGMGGVQRRVGEYSRIINKKENGK